MFMNKYISILGLACLVAATSVAQQETASYLADNSIRLEQKIVEHTDNNLIFRVNFLLDSLELPSNGRYVFTVILKDREGENSVELPQIVMNGRKQDISYRRGGYRMFDDETVVVKRNNNKPQTLYYEAVVPYEEWMRNSDIELVEDYCGCGDVLNQKTSNIHKLRTPDMPYVRPEAEAQKVRHEEGRAFIDFPVDKITLYPDYRNNPRELNRIIETINLVKNDRNTSITGISIHGFASPESPYEHNAYLAENRANTLKDYVRKLLNLEDSIFTVEFTPEDWEGLRRYVEESGLDNREEILSLIDDGSLEPDTKEWRMKLRYPDDYRIMLENWYPALRHSDYVVTYNVRPFSVEEAKEILKTKPQQLSLEEMFLVAQTYQPGSREFNEVMETAVRMFPEDETANINAACARMEQGDLEAAAEYLEKTGDSPEALHAKGVLAMLQGDMDKAERLLNAAKDAGNRDAEENLKLID